MTEEFQEFVRRGRAAQEAIDKAIEQVVNTPAVPLYLERHEIVVLLRALAKAVQDDDGILPNDPTALSKMVWDAPWASSTAKSLATALAEATY